MSEKIVEYRKIVLDVLSRFTQDNGHTLASKILTIVSYTDAMLRMAETNEDLQTCAETIIAIKR